MHGQCVPSQCVRSTLDAKLTGHRMTILLHDTRGKAHRTTCFLRLARRRFVQLSPSLTGQYGSVAPDAGATRLITFFTTGQSSTVDT